MKGQKQFAQWFREVTGFSYAEWASQQGTALPVSLPEAWEAGYEAGRHAADEEGEEE